MRGSVNSNHCFLVGSADQSTSWTSLHRFAVLFIALFIALGLTSYVRIHSDTYRSLPVHFFQSILPEKSPTPFRGGAKPPSWLSSEGGKRTFGAVTVIFPPKYTEQGGAEIFGDSINALTSAGKAEGIVPGSEFALGIFLPNDQTTFLAPIEIRFVLNAALIPPDQVDRFGVRMFDPTEEKWIPVDSHFDAARYALVASVRKFTPVPKDYELGWGWRTFFGIFPVASTEATPTIPPNTRPLLNNNSNLRAGPGTNYPVLRVASVGTPVEPVGITSDGRWYKLASGEWIAAFLVDHAPTVPVVVTTPEAPTSTPSPIATRTLLPIPTPQQMSFWERILKAIMP